MRSLRRIALLAILPVYLSGCGDDMMVPGMDDGPMTASIDGNSFVAQFATVSIVGGQYFVNGGGANQTAIGFQFPTTGTGTFTVGLGNPVSAGVTLGPASYIAGSNIGSGSVVVTRAESNRIEGTFSFTVEPSAGSGGSLSVTNGQFEIDF